MIKAVFAIPPEVHLLDVNGPAHIFYEAKEYGAAIDLCFVSMNTTSEVKSSAGLHFSNLVAFDTLQLGAGDILFIPGLDYSLIRDTHFMASLQPFLDWVTAQYHNGAHMCSVCTGTFLLAHTGLLDGKMATTHWKYFDEFAKQYPKVKLEKDRLFVSSDNIHSSAGVSSGIDLSLFLIEEFFSTKLAVDVAKEVVVYFRRSASDPQLSIFLQYRNHLDQRIHTIQDYLLNHLSDVNSIEHLAEQVYMSKRNLTRLFKKTLGITIGEYLEKLRVERAVSLLSENHKVDYVAEKVGLKSANQLRNILKRHQGLLPTDIAARNK